MFLELLVIGQISQGEARVCQFSEPRRGILMINSSQSCVQYPAIFNKETCLQAVYLLYCMYCMYCMHIFGMFKSLARQYLLFVAMVIRLTTMSLIFAQNLFYAYIQKVGKKCNLIVNSQTVFTSMTYCHYPGNIPSRYPANIY